MRTEARRQAILEAASQVFRAQGFEGATMDAISARVGGSKTTLYGYFESKEELFLAVVEQSIERQAAGLVQDIRAEADLETGLRRFAVGYLTRSLSEDVTANRRSIANLPDGTGLAARFYDRGLRAGFVRLSEQIAAAMRAGELRRADPWVAAMHLKGLIEQDLVDRRVLGALGEPPKEVIERAAGDGVDVFLRAYGPSR